MEESNPAGCKNELVARALLGHTESFEASSVEPPDPSWKKWGYIDHTGKLVIPPQFEDAKRFQGRFAVVSKRGKWIWIDKTGRTVTESEIDLIP